MLNYKMLCHFTLLWVSQLIYFVQIWCNFIRLLYVECVYKTRKINKTVKHYVMSHVVRMEFVYLPAHNTQSIFQCKHRNIVWSWSWKHISQLRMHSVTHTAHCPIYQHKKYCCVTALCPVLDNCIMVHYDKNSWMAITFHYDRMYKELNRAKHCNC